MSIPRLCSSCNSIIIRLHPRSWKQKTIIEGVYHLDSSLFFGARALSQPIIFKNDLEVPEKSPPLFSIFIRSDFSKTTFQSLCHRNIQFALEGHQRQSVPDFSPVSYSLNQKPSKWCQTFWIPRDRPACTPSNPTQLPQLWHTKHQNSMVNKIFKINSLRL